MSESKVMYKYRLAVTDKQTLALPDGASIMAVQAQGVDLCLWVEVPTTQSGVNVERTFLIRGTGRVFVRTTAERYLGTVQLNEFVWHVYQCLSSL